MMNDIMVDQETMDNVSTAAIVSIGAVECDLTTGEVGDTYYRVVELDKQKGTINAETLYWWMQQSDEARNALTVLGRINIREALLSFTNWIYSLEANSKLVRLWGNGASFDNAILRQNYRFYDIEFPIEFWNDRDMRTIVGFYPKQLQHSWRHSNYRQGVHHNALADAKHQVKYCSDILKELGVKELY